MIASTGPTIMADSPVYRDEVEMLRDQLDKPAGEAAFFPEVHDKPNKEQADPCVARPLSS